MVSGAHEAAGDAAVVGVRPGVVGALSDDGSGARASGGREGVERGVGFLRAVRLECGLDTGVFRSTPDRAGTGDHCCAVDRDLDADPDGAEGGPGFGGIADAVSGVGELRHLSERRVLLAEPVRRR